ncbi:unnamed protein product [Amoebophrya sp. A25]|nr:unnamed protein product [Amoebophrya sp. A25]|eukprot:GSA25T00022916001.1
MGSSSIEKRAPESAAAVAVEPKKKKRKTEKTAEAEAPAIAEVSNTTAATGEESSKKKKKKKNKDAAEEAPAAPAPAKEEATTTSEETVSKKKKKKNKGGEEAAAPAAVEEAPVAVAAETSGKKKKKDKQEATTATSTSATSASSSSDEKCFKSDPFYGEHNISVSGCPTPKPATSFKDSGLPQEISTLCEKKFGASGKPSPIQAVAWPLILQGKDVFGIAKTGSGKSLAFVLPYLAKRLAENSGVNTSSGKKNHYPAMVCMAPTKELVQQIAEVAEEFTSKLKMSLTVHCIIGGVNKGIQISKIKSSACDVVAATPGRLLDLVENDQVLNLSKCEYLVLDEADRMLDDGFILNIRKISEYATSDKVTRQTVLFSATWPMEVNKLARGLLGKGRNAATITVLRKDQTLDDPENINTEDKLQLNDAISQTLHVLPDGRRKWELLLKNLRANPNKKILVFGLYKKEVANLENWLQREGFKLRALQGDMTQDKRTQSIEDYKTNKARILVATDVAARGLDIPDIDVVLNYTFPLTVEDFVHRCGRTGRAGRKGAAITFFNTTGEHKEREHCFDLIRLLEGAKQPVPEELRKINANTFVATKKKSHGMYGDFFKSAEEMEKLSKKKVQMTFDSDSD